MSWGTKGSRGSVGLVALVVAASVIASGCRSSNNAPAASIPGTGTTGGFSDTTVLAATVPPARGPGPGPGATGNLVTLAVQAKSAETTGSVGGQTSVHLAGSSVLVAMGDVIDRSGRDLGNGTLRAVGSDLVVTGPGIVLSTRLRVQPGQVTVNNGAGSGGATLTLPGGSTIMAASMTFQPPAPSPAPAASPAPAPAAAASSPSPSPPPPSSTAPAPTTTVAAPVAVTGPVKVQPGAVQVTGSGLRWLDAPASLHVTASEADLSWAGSGSIATGAGPVHAAFLGVRAQQLDATLRRDSSSVDMRGTGVGLQVFANGVPQLRTAARFDVLSTHATTGFLGRRRAFVWTPRNLGSTYDMAILRIRPGNAAAGGVHIGLRPMPPMFGGEPQGLVGGDTSGLKSGDAIDSLIARNGDDKRTVGYDGPAGVNLVLIIEGNFDPVVVSVTTS